MWYHIICPFEGPTDEGASTELYLEWDSDFDEHEVWNHILENKGKLSDFYEHSIDTETIRELDVSEEEIKEKVAQDIFKPDYALFKDGTVYKMKYIGTAVVID